MNSDYRLTISSAKIVRLLIFSSAALIVLSSVGQLVFHLSSSFPLRSVLIYGFSLNGERNIPALFSGLLLLVCSGLLLLVGYMKGRVGDRDYSYWLGLSLIFLALSVDEICSLHEKAIEPMRNLGFDSGFLYYSWIVLAIPLIALMGLIFVGFLRRLPKATMNGFLLSALVYLGGAIFMESIGGHFAEDYGKATVTYSIIFTIEETLELLGILMLINTIFNYIGGMKIDTIKVNLLIK